MREMETVLTITQDIIESYIHCRYKAYLKLIGQAGTKSDYENLCTDLRREVRRKALNKIYSQTSDKQIITDVVFSNAILKQEPEYIFDAYIDWGQFEVKIDGAKRTVNNKQEQPVYIPIMFHDGSKIRKEQRLLLELCGAFLFSWQSVVSTSGLIWYSNECRQSRIQLNTDSQNVKRIQLDLKKIAQGEIVPDLILNRHCGMCEFQNRCYEEARQKDSLSLISSIKAKEHKSFNRRGILTVTQLAHTFRPRRKRKDSTQTSKRRSHSLQALAIKDEKIYVYGDAHVPDDQVQIYLDIESKPDENFVYLIGMIIVETDVEEHFSFWADHKGQQSEIFEQFVAEVTKRDNFVIYCYGSYERTFIKKMTKNSPNKSAVERIMNALVNVLSIIYTHFYFPTYSNGLKSIARYLGFQWTDPNASGLQSVVWRVNWGSSNDQSLKDKILTYNFEDCTALKLLTETMRRISTSKSDETESTSKDSDKLPVGIVDDIETQSYYHKWKEVDFVQPDFDFVNKRAYFDYQRDRVYVRSSAAIKKATKTKSPSRNRSIPASKKITIRASQCPFCSSKNIRGRIQKKVRTQEPRVKRAFDIRFTPTGVKRRVIECRTSIHKCLDCNEEFVPLEHQNLDKHFHGFKSWIMYQHVKYRINLRMLSNMIEDFFGIRLAYAEIHMIKVLLAQYYESTNQLLMESIIAGKLVHVDETEIKFRKTEGYVWVFTNLEEVVYLYRPSRESDFLHEKLADFKGVLVSDFYSGYDSLECLQQKCLVHLIRDINQDLLNNPFDDELKKITEPFGVLLREIVATIDEHGLTKKYLTKHAKSVDEFFHAVSNQVTSSDVAEALRDRLIRNRDKLFTFIHQDGIPWNNNNAEHAIKHFAYYREINNRIITESGLENYLILLSICQTCSYKGIDFLKFLLSKELDISAFSRRQHQRIPLEDIELYPDGYIPQHMRYRRRKKEALTSNKNEAEELEK